MSFAVLAGRSRGLTGQPGGWRSPWFPLGPVLGLMLATAFGVTELLDAALDAPACCSSAD